MQTTWLEVGSTLTPHEEGVGECVVSKPLLFIEHEVLGYVGDNARKSSCRQPNVRGTNTVVVSVLTLG